MLAARRKSYAFFTVRAKDVSLGLKGVKEMLYIWATRTTNQNMYT
jgi:hypothetical protein